MLFFDFFMEDVRLLFERVEIILKEIESFLEGMGVLGIGLGFKLFKIDLGLQLNEFKFVGFDGELQLLF